MCYYRNMAVQLYSNPIVFATVIVTTFSCWLSVKFQLVQPAPFLDEVFHVPQAKAYCRGNFTVWDDKITTLPGLYLLSAGILKPLSFILKDDLCTTAGLRLLNTVAAIINLILIYRIHQKHRPKNEQRFDYKKEIVSCVSIGTFPVLYFFSFLYYTDTFSTGLVLLTYLLDLENSYYMATFTGIVAIFVRQINIVWVAFIAFLSLARVLKEHVKYKIGPSSSSLLKSFGYFRVLWQTLMKIWRSEAEEEKRNFAKNIIKNILGYLSVGICFMAFVIWNHGLVVGDRAAHTAVINIPQVFYYSLFTVFFAAPHVVFYSKDFILCLYGHKKQAIMFFLICTLTVHFDTHVHPYLLADNRHYTFYIWKRLYERHFLAKYALIPFYMFGVYSMYKMLKVMDIFFILGYFTFTFICLVPQKLLEFRYFIIPFLFLRIHYYPKWFGQLVAELLIFFFVNCATFHLFLTRTFFWPDSNETQRFLW
ncbi:putative Dol-P-Glc:Glc(2)Man(9)GlcNAc(2)-PP-Dol alpha-1 [Blattella germanica]|nr:putative Dol-P-Glc:Glc(2)Man(9)GlcNAc(2)-PP-Dol alpha-1 [Blattella germanica]